MFLLTDQIFEEMDDEMDLKKELTFTTCDDDSNVNVHIYDEDTSEAMEINVSRLELMKILSMLNCM